MEKRKEKKTKIKKGQYGPRTRSTHTKNKSSTMEPRSQDTFTSVYGPQFPSTNFGLQTLPSTFNPHDTHSLLQHARARTS